MISDRQRLANLNHSPKARNAHVPDPTWKAQQAFIRATRRGSKKHASMEKKLELLDAAQKAVPPAGKSVPVQAIRTDAAGHKTLGPPTMMSPSQIAAIKSDRASRGVCVECGNEKTNHASLCTKRSAASADVAQR